jgi:CRP/FNR family transcriptional regulator
MFSKILTIEDPHLDHCRWKMDINSAAEVKPFNTRCSQCSIRKASIFKNIDADSLRRVEQYRKGQITMPAHSSIFHEGKTHQYVYTLFSGWVVIYKMVGETGRRQIMQFLLPGDLLGYQTDANGDMPLSAKTLTETVLCVFPREKINPMLRENSDLSVRFIEMWSRDMSLCQNYLMAVGRKTARESVTFLLLELYYRVKSQEPQSYSSSVNAIYFPITQEDIGDAVGLTKVHVNRVIKSLMDGKLIYCHKKKLAILNEDKLCEIAGYDNKIATAT